MLLFVDESGHDRSGTPYEVLAGVAVAEEYASGRTSIANLPAREWASSSVGGVFFYRCLLSGHEWPVDRRDQLIGK